MQIGKDGVLLDFRKSARDTSQAFFESKVPITFHCENGLDRAGIGVNIPTSGGTIKYQPCKRERSDVAESHATSLGRGSSVATHSASYTSSAGGGSLATSAPGSTFEK
jgi:hypothetical protein